jgi:hypothetical protein
LICLLLTSFSSSGCAYQQQKSNAQQGQKTDKVPPPSPDEITELINDARGVPAEFAADALIRIATSNKITNQEQKRALLEEAFRLASGAQQPLRRVSLPGSLVDTRSGYLSRAYERKLDTLSLQARAVKALMAVDKNLARQLFAEIPKLKLQPLSCEDSLVYEVSDFYETLGSVALGAFKKEEIAANEHIYFVRSYVEGMASPVQVEPVARVILSVGKNYPDQLGQLVSAYSAALTKISADDRSFSFSISKGKGGRGIIELVVACKQQNIPADDLLKAAREYFVRHLSGRRCADNIEVKDRNFSDPKYIDNFNSLLSETVPGRKSLPLITEDDIKTSAFAGRVTEYPYWQTLESKKLLTGVKKLGFGADNKPITDEQKKEAAWQLSLREFLNELSAWDESSEKSEADFFHQKSILFETLLRSAPSGPERDNVLNTFTAFLSKPIIQHDSRIDWFLHADALIKTTHSTDPDRSKILEILSRSGDPILQLYARLENVLPQSKP